MFILLSFLIVLLIVSVGLYIAFLIECIVMQRPGRVIYHGSNLREQGEILKDVIRRYDLPTKEMVLVEPGAGLGKVAEYLSKAFRWKKVIAIELGSIILFIARIRAFFRRMRVKFEQEDILLYHFPKNACIYCYLTTPLLDALYKRGELAGRFVITLTFPITGVAETEKISLHGWQGDIFVYNFQSSAPSDSK